MFKRTSIVFKKKKSAIEIKLPTTATAPITTTEAMQTIQEKKQAKWIKRIVPQIGRVLGAFSSVLGVIGGLYSTYQICLSWIYETDEKFEVVIYRRSPWW